MEHDNGGTDGTVTGVGGTAIGDEKILAFDTKIRSRRRDETTLSVVHFWKSSPSPQSKEKAKKNYEET